MAILNFFVQVITVTSEIYTKTDEVISIQQLGVLLIIVGASTIAIVVLIILLKKWNIILAGGAKRRTQQLEDSYEKMRIYIEQVQAEPQRENQEE
jgi:hypothetical protein